jgi:hypothetical protein
MAVQLFLSCVSPEFGRYREPLRKALALPDLAVTIQEDFKPQGGDTLSLFMDYISPCAAVVHFVGDMAGATPRSICVEALLRKYPDIKRKLPPLGEALDQGEPISYTQWEAWLALYLEKAMLIVTPATDAPRGPNFAATRESRALQAMHLARLQAIDMWPGEPFANADILATQVLRSSVIPALKKAAFKTDSVAPSPFDIARVDRYAPTKLIGREAETKLIEDVWARAVAGEAQRPRVMAFVALGGEGKTALVAKWAVGMAEKGWPHAEAAFGWSFHSQGSSEQQASSSDLFLAEALKFFGAPAVEGESLHDKGRRLAAFVSARRAALILDGLGPLQHPPTSPLAGQLKDDGLSALLRGLVQSSKGVCVVTTNYRIRDIEAYAAAASQHDLAPLSSEAGAQLLQTLGVKGTQREREKLTEDVKGHALTLTIIGAYLRDAYDGDVRQRGRIKFWEADADERGGHAFRAMHVYADWFESDGEKGQRALAMLRLMSLFDRPADSVCLGTLWTGDCRADGATSRAERS